MTPKEKANDLIHKFFANALPDAVECDLNVGKRCALIAVDEMIIQNGELYLLGLAKEYYIEKNAYLFNVKSELQSL